MHIYIFEIICQHLPAVSELKDDIDTIAFLKTKLVFLLGPIISRSCACLKGIARFF